MITDVPTADEFRRSGVAFLNLAWNIASQLEFHFDNAEISTWDDDGEVTDEYWAAAQSSLATAMTLAQQGSDFLLKSRIAEVSPYLLISSFPSDWPKRSYKADVPYSAFKTVDAQDLIRVHDTVAATRLPSAFLERFDSLRRRRNMIMHTVNRHMRFAALDVFREVLEVSQALVGDCEWIGLRRGYLETNSEAIAYSCDPVPATMAQEFLRLVERLPQNDVKKHFDFDKKRRRYYCYECQMNCRDYYIEVRSAQLRPNSPHSRQVYCFICGKTQDVVRRHCTNRGCKGNVLDATDNTCLTCFS